MWNLKGKKAVVTGGTKGIGKAIVKEFLQLGAEVLFTARDKKLLQESVEGYQKEGYAVHGLRGDVSNADDRARIVDWVGQHFRQLDILVNNAGLNIRKASSDYSEAEYMQVINTDLVAPFELSRSLFGRLKEAEKASVINVASVAGVMDANTGAPYGMAKSGLIQMSRNLAVEWAPFGIRVNTVSPWFTTTPATSGVLSNPEMKELIVSRTPAGRVAEAEEVAAAVSFFAMDKASFISGQHLLVDGGATSKIL